MSRKKTVIIVIALAMTAALSISIVQFVRKNNIMKEASDLYGQGEYAQAIELLEPFDDPKSNQLADLCRAGQADQEATALLEDGKAGQALALLKGRNPGSEMLPQVVEARAAELIEQGKAGEAYRVLEREGIKDSEYALNVEQMAKEQEFQECLEKSDTQNADWALTRIYHLNEQTGRLSEEALKGMRTELYNAEKRMEAEGYISEENYHKAFNVYESIDDQDGMRKTLELMEAAGDYRVLFDRAHQLNDREMMGRAVDGEASSGYLSDALDDAITMDDMDRTSTLLDRVIAEDALVTVKDGKGCLKHGIMIARLADRTDDEAAVAIVQKYMAEVYEKCKAMADEGRYRDAHDALVDMRKIVLQTETVWPEEYDALIDSSWEQRTKSHVVRDTGLIAAKGATITVYTGQRDACLVLHQTTEPNKFTLEGEREATGESVYVYVEPNSHFTFTVLAGYYDAYVSRGHNWLGDSEGFGPNATYTHVQISFNRYNSGDGRRLEGSYSLDLR